MSLNIHSFIHSISEHHGSSEQCYERSHDNSNSTQTLNRCGCRRNPRAGKWNGRRAGNTLQPFVAEGQSVPRAVAQTELLGHYRVVRPCSGREREMNTSLWTMNSFETMIITTCDKLFICSNLLCRWIMWWVFLKGGYMGNFWIYLKMQLPVIILYWEIVLICFK